MGIRRTRLVLAAALAMVVQAALFLAVWLHRWDALLDDAYISFRYAARWAEGRGLTWNDGVYVEGFSNPLWTLGLGIVDRVTGLPPHVTAPWLGLAALLAMAPVLLVLVRSLGLGAQAAVLLLGLQAVDAGMALWAGSGMETVPTALLVAGGLAASAALARTPRFGLGVVLGLFCALQTVSRPEGIVWAGIAGIWLIWGAWAPLRVLAGWALGLAPALGFLLFRWVTYHQFVPNTFFAKVETDPSAASHGVLVAGRWVLLYLPVLLVLAWSVWRRRVPGGTSASRMARFWWTYPAGLVLVELAFLVAAGGDWMGATRYMTPVLPACLILVAGGVSLWPGRSAVRNALVAGMIVIQGLVGWTWRDTIPTYTREGRVLGEWLHAVAAPGERVAVTAAGAIPYFAKMPAYDILGLNDPEVAGRPTRHRGAWTPGHHRYDLDRLLEVEPEWIVWDFSVQVNRNRMRRYRPGLADPDSLDYRRSLLARERFRELYSLYGESPASTQNAYTVFRRRR